MDLQLPDSDWSVLEETAEWQAIIARLQVLESEIRAKMENPELVASVEDLRFWQGQLRVIRDIYTLPKRDADLKRLLRKNQIGAGKADED